MIPKVDKSKMKISVISR